MKYVIGMVLLVVAAGFVFRNDINQLLIADSFATASAKEEKKKEGKKGEGKKEKTPQDAAVQLEQQWTLPPVLREVSGIAYMDKDRFACIQDEDGVIYIYNRAEDEIEKEIPFAGPGDYEGIALNEGTAYVVRADGQLYEVPLDRGQKGVKTFRTPLTEAHNVEGLFYDKGGNRLLLAIKDDEPHTKAYKGIYAFDLGSNTFVENPVFKINLKDPVLQQSGGKKEKAIKPSEVAIHPVTGEIYITDGPAARLLVLHANGNAKRLYHLGNDFPQAEGIAFSPDGTLFISNEGKERGNIIQVALQ